MQLVASYRTQFRNGMTFERAIEQLPYLQGLGISHIYASPIFTAAQGSTHGYDVTNANEIDPSLGARAGFDDFSRHLKAHGMGLILDIVPNHMAASLDNPWWHDVLANGESSRYASHFDIDWAEPLTLPHLELAFDDTAARGKFNLVRDRGEAFRLQFGDSLYPLSAESLDWLDAQLEEVGGEPGKFVSQPEKLSALHRLQHWQLVAWTTASKHLSYRRFFEVTGLVGVRVEDPMVFDAMHALVLELVKSGQVDGLRIDHVDGLADPKGYLECLRRAVGSKVPIYVEKILARDEALASDWPVEGTTGYEFISAISDIFTSKQGVAQLKQHYSILVPDLADPGAGLRQAKLQMVTVNFAGEVDRLVKLAAGLLPGIDLQSIAASIRELLVAFPVYRLYNTTQALTAAEDHVLDHAALVAREHVQDQTAVDAVVNVLRGQDDPTRDPTEFRRRFQQVAGPVMAKAMEDTFFYRYNCLLAANEVGGDPIAEPMGIAGFHRHMQRRMREQPLGMSSTSTHDTKRGEDARARLYAISEGVDDWMTALPRWRLSNAALVSHPPTGMVPDLNLEWMLYQALLGVIPSRVDIGDLPVLRERFSAYALKAVREAKLHTDWSAPDQSYEKAVQHFAEGVLSPENMAFVNDFIAFSRPFVASGNVNSLVQTLVKLVAPGIPDFYQGAEGLDQSLVDPDNRRPWAGAAVNLQDTESLASTKLDLIKRGLWLRRQKPILFERGEYIAVSVEGQKRDHVLAFARRHANDLVVAIAPLQVFDAVNQATMKVDASFWGDTTVRLSSVSSGGLRNALDGTTHACEDLPVSELFKLPVALLATTTA